MSEQNNFLYQNLYGNVTAKFNNMSESRKRAVRRLGGFLTAGLVAANIATVASDLKNKNDRVDMNPVTWTAGPVASIVEHIEGSTTSPSSYININPSAEKAAFLGIQQEANALKQAGPAPLGDIQPLETAEKH